MFFFPPYSYDYYLDRMSHIIQWKRCILVLFLWSIWITLYLLDCTEPLNNKTANRTVSPQFLTKSTKPLPLILYWTRNFPSYWLVDGDVNWIPKNPQKYCKNWNCEITTDERLISNSSAVIFKDLVLDFENIPKRSHSSQIYVYTQQDPPHIVRNAGKLEPLKTLADVFNLTMTYHENSDVQSTFGILVFLTETARLKPQYKKLKYPWVQFKDHLNLNWDYKPLSTNLNFTELRKKIRNKTKMALWANTNTDLVESGRAEYIKELSQYFPVDLYSHNPGGKSCSVENCYEIWENDYKFYLAFENSFSKDYITEKPYKIFTISTIPVVRGGADYAKILPPKSYINAQDFESPKELASFLINLSEDASEYASYFDWKKDFGMVFFSGVGHDHDLHTVPCLCDLCDILNSPNIKTKVVHDIYAHVSQ